MGVAVRGSLAFQAATVFFLNSGMVQAEDIPIPQFRPEPLFSCAVDTSQMTRRERIQNAFHATVLVSGTRAPQFPTEENGFKFVRPSPYSGSGIVIDAERGLIVTNEHVIGDAQITRKITFYDRDRRDNLGHEVNFEVVGSDEASDIAVLKIPPDNLTCAPFGASADIFEGDPVFAVGHPFANYWSYDQGFVANTNRRASSGPSLYDTLQSNMSINPGNSGGATFDMDGEVISINDRLHNPAVSRATKGRGSSSAGISYSIPSEYVQKIVYRILEEGEIKRGYAGYSARNLFAYQKQKIGLRDGAHITNVNEDSPAEKAGILKGDIIVEAGGIPLQDYHDLFRHAMESRPDEITLLKVYRDGKIFEAEMTFMDQEVYVAQQKAKEEMLVSQQEETQEDIVEVTKPKVVGANSHPVMQLP